MITEQEFRLMAPGDLVWLTGYNAVYRVQTKDWTGRDVRYGLVHAISGTYLGDVRSDMRHHELLKKMPEFNA